MRDNERLFILTHYQCFYVYLSLYALVEFFVRFIKGVNTPRPLITNSSLKRLILRQHFLKTKSHEESWRKFAFKNFLQPLFQKQLSQAGLGTISEIFDGSVPHISRGCISQAWSVAEPLRAYVEDVTLKRPPHEKEVLETLAYW
jgi:hypothetical protein